MYHWKCTFENVPLKEPKSRTRFCEYTVDVSKHTLKIELELQEISLKSFSHHSTHLDSSVENFRLEISVTTDDLVMVLESTMELQSGASDSEFQNPKVEFQRSTCTSSVPHV